jgi:phage terminase large subunit
MAKMRKRDIARTFDEFLDAYRSKPVLFVREVLGQEPLPWQEEFLGALAAGKRRITVRAGHGVGKSTACAWATVWFLCTRYPQKTVMTAPTAGQLFDALFSELKAQLKRLPDVLRESFEVYADRVVFKAAPESSFCSARTSSSERPEALAGIHSENVLLICDEASAIPEPVYEAAAGSMSGHSACTILIGNPTRNSGMFYKTHHDLASNWHTMHVSCLDNRLVSTDFVEQIRTTYGDGSNAWRIRVMGEFALADSDTLISADLIDAARTRDVQASPLDPVVYGLDVARFGTDRTALCKRRGNVVEEVRSWGGLDTMQIVGMVHNEAQLDQPAEICVDTIGLGSGCADRLRELGYNVRDVNVSESSAMNPNAHRLRDELWLSVKDWLSTRAVRLPDDSALRAELVSPRYTFSSNGRLVVESKAELRKRGLRSPDLADALCLTFASNAAMVGGRASSWVKGKPLKRHLSVV